MCRVFFTYPSFSMSFSLAKWIRNDQKKDFSEFESSLKVFWPYHSSFVLFSKMGVVTKDLQQGEQEEKEKKDIFRKSEKEKDKNEPF